jgi:Fe-S-cluster-containing dehydrogenase component
MGISRRTALKGLAVAGSVAVAGRARAAERMRPAAPPDAVGLLYDTTRCIGCKACVAACAEANDLEPDDAYWPGGLYQAPLDLNERTKNVIKLFKGDDETSASFMKAQCMHCLDPACATACMLGAFKKRELGIVTWDGDFCIGCRYCQIACPFGVPKFEWSKALPRMVKCELCNHRIAQGGIPACVEVCPREAVIYGTRVALLAEAKRRLAEFPDRYVPHVYGETEGGGTQCLYLSHVPFEKLGLPTLTETPTAEPVRSLQHTIYRGFAAPLALYGALAVVMIRNRKAGAGRPATDEDAS